jgi:hypothetical protein
MASSRCVSDSRSAPTAAFGATDHWPPTRLWTADCGLPRLPADRWQKELLLLQASIPHSFWQRLACSVFSRSFDARGAGEQLQQP